MLHLFCCTAAELLITCCDSVSAPLPPPLFSPACFLPPGCSFEKPYGNQMGTNFWEGVCDGHDIGGSGEYCGDNDAHLGRISVL